MKSGIYSQPLRVYVVLAILALVGGICGLKLPISLFPNSAQPEVYVDVNLGSSTASEFLQTYGTQFENDLRKINAKDARVEKVEATYFTGRASYDITFAWGSDPDVSKRETQTVVNAWLPRYLVLVRLERVRVADKANMQTACLSASTPVFSHLPLRIPGQESGLNSCRSCPASDPQAMLK